MRTKAIFLAWGVALGLVASSASAQTADDVLRHADDVLHAAKDLVATSSMTITAKGGAKSERTLQLWQKGTDRRMIKFLSPAAQKGIGFLSLPGDNMSLYLPAYKKVRRIAAHVKNGKFAGTDYSYEDLEAKRYAELWTPTIKQQQGGEYVLVLTPKPGTQSDYSELEIHVRASDWYPTEVVFYRKGEQVKRMTATDVRPEKGVLMAHRTEMRDLKSGSVTTMQVQKVEVDSGLADDVFTDRNLQR